MQSMKFLTILLTIIIVQSCKCQKETTKMLDETQQEKPTEILNGTYSISSIENNKTLPENLNITFDKNTNKVSGFSGCNQFSGTYKTKGNTILFSKLSTTKMYCENIMHVEQKLLNILNNVNSFSVEKNQINLKNNNLILIQASKNNYTIIYSASSRGTFKKITINKKSISSLNKRGGTPIIKSCNEENWNSILKKLELININALSSLEAPSKKFQFDGAALAHLKITNGDNIYESPPFDHGNPPKEIEALVKEILSISENIE